MRECLKVLKYNLAKRLFYLHKFYTLKLIKISLHKGLDDIFFRAK